MSTNNKVIAIGDVHGYLDKLTALIEVLKPKVDMESDSFVLLGDYVDGGPDALGVISFIMEWQQVNPNVVALLGNHEDLLLNGLGIRESLCAPYIKKGDYYLWWSQGGKQTLDSYSRVFAHASEYDKAIMQPKDYVLPKHIDWMLNLPLTHENDSYIFVHAGLIPGETVETTSDFEKLWIRDEFIDSNYNWGKKVVYGHTYTKTPVVMHNKIGIDTCHHGGGPITAAIITGIDRNGPSVIEIVSSDDNWSNSPKH